MALPSDWATFLAAIRAQESGGNYNEDTAGCLGAYCWSDMNSWGDMAGAAGLGQYADTNPSQVPASVQDQVATRNLYREYQQAGGGNAGLSAAARWWNGGTTQSVPNPQLPAQAWASHCGGGSSGAYACQVLARMGLGGHYVAGQGSGSGGVVLTAAASAAVADCLIGWAGVQTPHPQDFFLGPISSFFSMLPFGLGKGAAKGIKGSERYSNVGGFCLLKKSQARGIFGAASFAGGCLIAGFGVAVILKTATPARALVILQPQRWVPAAAGAVAGQGAPGQPLTPAQVKQANANRAQLYGKGTSP